MTETIQPYLSEANWPSVHYVFNKLIVSAISENE